MRHLNSPVRQKIMFIADLLIPFITIHQFFHFKIPSILISKVIKGAIRKERTSLEIHTKKLNYGKH